MKKFISVIIILLLVINLSACSSTNYRYADNWEVKNAETVDAISSIEKYAKPEVSEYDKLIKSIKEVVRAYISYPELLDWSKFDQLQTVKELDSESISNLPDEEAFTVYNYVALYDADNDCCYLLPRLYTLDASSQVYALMHEVIHSLVDNKKDAENYQLIEGMVDWLAFSICEEKGIYVTPSYQESITCLKILMDIYGEEEILRAICENTVADLIDGSTKPGMTEKLNYALAIAHATNSGSENVKKAVHAELDILAHAAKHEGADISDWLDILDDAYNEIGVKLNINYFRDF